MSEQAEKMGINPVSSCHVETVVQLSKGCWASGGRPFSADRSETETISSQNVRVEFSLEDMDMSRFQQGTAYEQIQEWVKEKYGFHVTHLNIAKTKRKCRMPVSKMRRPVTAEKSFSERLTDKLKGFFRKS